MNHPVLACQIRQEEPVLDSYEWHWWSEIVEGLPGSRSYDRPRARLKRRGCGRRLRLRHHHRGVR